MKCTVEEDSNLEVIWEVGKICRHSDKALIWEDNKCERHSHNECSNLSVAMKTSMKTLTKE